MPKSWKQVTEVDFKLIKSLDEAGMSLTKIHKITGRGAETINRILQATDMKDYARITRERGEAYRIKAGIIKPREDGTLPIAGIDYDAKAVVPEPVKPTQVWQFGDESNHLERIAVALERMADAWEKPGGEPSKRGIFGLTK